MEKVNHRLRQLADAYQRRVDLGRQEAQLVAAARAGGATWREICIAVQLTESCAQRRFSRTGEGLDGEPGLTRREAVSRLGAMPAAWATTQRRIVAGVVAARAAGATWQQIGDVINMRRSNAAMKYGPAVRGRPVTASRRPRVARSGRD